MSAGIGRPEPGTVRVHRDADEVFRTESPRPFDHKAASLDHPAAPATPAS